MMTEAKEQIAAADWVLQTKRLDAVDPALALLAPALKRLPGDGPLPEQLAPEYRFARRTSQGSGITAPSFQHRVIYPSKDLTPDALKAFIAAQPAIERVKGWLVNPPDGVLVQATRAHFQTQAATSPQGLGLQFIWRGGDEIDFSALT